MLRSARAGQGSAHPPVHQLPGPSQRAKPGCLSGDRLSEVNFHSSVKFPWTPKWALHGFFLQTCRVNSRPSLPTSEVTGVILFPPLLNWLLCLLFDGFNFYFYFFFLSCFVLFLNSFILIGG